DRKAALLGNYSYPVLAGAVQLLFTALEPASAGGIQPMSADMVGDVPGTVAVQTALAAIRAALGDASEVGFAPGCTVAGGDGSEIAEAVALAARSSAAIVVAGDQSGLITAGTVGEGIDSAGCELPGVQRELVEAVAATGTPTVLILLCGRPLVLD